MLTCDSPDTDLIDGICKALKAKEMLTLRMPGDKRPYNFPLPIKREKPTEKGGDSIQQYRPYMVAEYLEWARSPGGIAKIAKVEEMWSKTGKTDAEQETVSDEDDDLL